MPGIGKRCHELRIDDKNVTWRIIHRIDRGIRSHSNSSAAEASRPQPICQPISVDKIVTELDSLPVEQLLLSAGGMCVFRAQAAQIPNTLIELGRQREITFRGVGEGTGNDLDLDPFDQTCTHLLLWNRDTSELVGAYRLAFVDGSVQRRFPEGLYSHTLFD